MKCQALYCNSLNTLWGGGEKKSRVYNREVRGHETSFSSMSL